MAPNPEFDPSKHSTFTLAGMVLSHVLQKGFQAGGVLGLGVAAPAYCLYKKSFDPKLVTSTVAYSALGMTAFSGIQATGMKRKHHEYVTRAIQTIYYSHMRVVRLVCAQTPTTMWLVRSGLLKSTV